MRLGNIFLKSKPILQIRLRWTSGLNSERDSSSESEDNFASVSDRPGCATQTITSPISQMKSISKIFFLVLKMLE